MQSLGCESNCLNVLVVLKNVRMLHSARTRLICSDIPVRDGYYSLCSLTSGCIIIMHIPLAQARIVRLELIIYDVCVCVCVCVCVSNLQTGA